MNTNSVPESVREQMRKAGRARAKQITKAERKEYGKKAWKTRCENASKK